MVETQGCRNSVTENCGRGDFHNHWLILRPLLCWRFTIDEWISNRVISTCGKQQWTELNPFSFLLRGHLGDLSLWLANFEKIYHTGQSDQNSHIRPSCVFKEPAKSKSLVRSWQACDTFSDTERLYEHQTKVVITKAHLSPVWSSTTIAALNLVNIRLWASMIVNV